MLKKSIPGLFRHASARRMALPCIILQNLGAVVQEYCADGADGAKMIRSSHASSVCALHAGGGEFSRSLLVLAQDSLDLRL